MTEQYTAQQEMEVVETTAPADRKLKTLNQDIMDLKADFRNNPFNEELENQINELETEYSKLEQQQDDVVEEKELSDVEENKTQGEDENMENVEEIETMTPKFDGGLQFKLDKVANPMGELQIKEFDWSIFSDFDKEVEAITADYERVASDRAYSAEYKAEKRTDALIKIHDLNSKYRELGLKQLEELRTPEVKRETLTAKDEELNVMKRLNNNIILSTIINNGTVQDLQGLFQENQDNAEARAMITAKLNGMLQNGASGSQQSEIIKLKVAIDEYEKQAKHVDYFKELDEIEAGLKRAFNQLGTNQMIPKGLENGFSGFSYKRFLN